MERRRAIRYPLQVPAAFSLKSELVVVIQSEGHTRNISEKGVFVDAPNCPPIGVSVELHFSLPAFLDSERQMHVQHTGEILRLEGTEQGQHCGGFAIMSREAVWRYEDETNFGRSEKELL